MGGKNGLRPKLPRLMPVRYREDFASIIDGRSRLAREVRDRLSALVADLGGEDALSHAQRSLCRRAVWLDLCVEHGGDADRPRGRGKASILDSALTDEGQGCFSTEHRPTCLMPVAGDRPRRRHGWRFDVLRIERARRVRPCSSVNRAKARASTSLSAAAHERPFTIRSAIPASDSPTKASCVARDLPLAGMLAGGYVVAHPLDLLRGNDRDSWSQAPPGYR